MASLMVLRASRASLQIPFIMTAPIHQEFCCLLSPRRTVSSPDCEPGARAIAMGQSAVCFALAVQKQETIRKSLTFILSR